MEKHETKICPRCFDTFECKAGSILLCQCNTISLKEEESHYINQQFDDCLCINCMKDLKKEYNRNLFKEKLKKISRLFNS